MYHRSDVIGDVMELSPFVLFLFLDEPFVNTKKGKVHLRYVKHKPDFSATVAHRSP